MFGCGHAEPRNLRIFEMARPLSSLILGHDEASCPRIKLNAQNDREGVDVALKDFRLPAADWTHIGACEARILD